MNRQFDMQPVFVNDGMPYTGMNTGSKNGVSGGEAACGPGGCGLLGDACFEPEGRTTSFNWKYVGNGRGGYEKVTTMKYVGDGGGGFEKQVRTPEWCSTICKCCASLTLIVLVCAMMYLGFTFMAGPGELWSFPEKSADVARSLYKTPPPTLLAGTDGQTPEFTYDCVDDGTVLTWLVKRREYCCGTFGFHCDDPLPVLSAEEASEALRQEAAALEASPLAADGEEGSFDCLLGLHAWETAWSSPQKAWCCRRTGVGCPVTAAQPPPPASPPAAMPAVAPPPPAALPHYPPMEEVTTGKPFGTWNAEMDDLPFDPEAVFDCKAGVSRWEKGWSTIKKQWCCKRDQVACDPYNCDEDAARWQGSWEPAKKAWCCAHGRLGCSTPPSPDPGGEVGFSCHIGLDDWQRNWSQAKQGWCCAHERLACPKF